MYLPWRCAFLLQHTQNTQRQHKDNLYQICNLQSHFHKREILPEFHSSSRWWQSRVRASWGTSPASWWLRSETTQILPETVKNRMFDFEKTNHKGEDFGFFCGGSIGIGNRLERRRGWMPRFHSSWEQMCRRTTLHWFPLWEKKHQNNFFVQNIN